jgi:hypothetical protein
MAMPIFEGRQIAAARALANVSVRELAEDAGVTERTIGRFEVNAVIAVSPRRRHGHVSAAVFDKIVAALRRRGVELVNEAECHGAGARWASPRARRS